MAIDMTEQEVADLVANSPDCLTGDLTGRRPEFSLKLAGKNLTLRSDDGPTIKYSFIDRHKLIWDSGEGEREEYYEAFQIDKSIFLVAYLIKDSRPATSVTAVLDIEMNLMTLIISTMGTPLAARYVGQKIYHGVIESEGTRYSLAWRHHPTRELVGGSMGWSYRDDICSQHIYGSPYSIAWVILNGPGTGLLGTAPCKYYKINDHVYLYSWVETFGSGQQGVVLMNLHLMHDVGTFYGITHGQRFEFYAYGARGYNLGSYNTKDLFKW
jgi:hypothetical protein